MKIFVTGVGGQLGHDVMNELAKRGYEGIGSDIAPEYSGAADAVCPAGYHGQRGRGEGADGNQAGCGDTLCSLDGRGSGRG